MDAFAQLPSANVGPTRRAIRAEIRHRRRALTPGERHACAYALSRVLARTSLYRRSRRIAVYLPNDGEMDLTPLIARSWSMGKTTYVPVLHGPRLWFLPLTAESVLVYNRFGIPEPRITPNARCHPHFLDLVLMPLVAFDAQGSRLGMGGGYYDRTFAALRRRKSWRRPRLLGVAYEFQRHPGLPAQAWDVPMTGVATERGLEEFRTHA